MMPLATKLWVSSIDKSQTCFSPVYSIEVIFSQPISFDRKFSLVLSSELMASFFKLREFQLKEFSKYWFDLSKLVFASLILKFFEPEVPKLTSGSFLTMFSGLTISAFLATVGLRLSKEVKEG